MNSVKHLPTQLNLVNLHSYFRPFNFRLFRLNEFGKNVAAKKSTSPKLLLTITLWLIYTRQTSILKMINRKVNIFLPKLKFSKNLTLKNDIVFLQYYRFCCVSNSIFLLHLPNSLYYTFSIKYLIVADASYGRIP